MSVADLKFIKEQLNKKIKNEYVSKSELATLMGVTRHNIYNLLDDRKENKISKANIFFLAHLLGIRLEELKEAPLHYSTKSSLRVDFGNLKAIGQDFSRRFMQYVNFSDGRFKKINFSGADVMLSEFRNTELDHCNFSGSQLQGVNFYKAKIIDCNMHNANLTETYLKNTNFEHSDLRGANLKNTDLTHAKFEFTNLTGVDFEGIKNWDSCSFHYCLITNIKNAPKGFERWLEETQLNIDNEKDFKEWKKKGLPGQ